MTVLARNNGVFLAAASREVIPYLGLLPEMICNGDAPIHENLANNYPWFSGWTTDSKATVDSEGVYRYPQDPPLTPICTYTKDDVIVYQYDYGIVCVIEQGTFTKWARFD